MAITASELPKLMMAADDIWTANKDQYTPQNEIWKAIRAEQTANVSMVESRDGKDRVARIVWVNACDVVAADCADTCAITGPRTFNGRSRP